MTSADRLTAMVRAASDATEARSRHHDRRALEAAADAAPRAVVSFRDSLAAPGIRVIAECKRRSPSRGILRAAYDPAAIARGYALAGAAAISVLTEGEYFDGSLEHLRAVRAAVRVPVLRKDFITSEAQLLEARAAGADAALLIVAALDDASLAALIARSVGLGLDPLVEVHDAVELDRAVQAGASLVGVNSRNLKTLDVRLETFDDLAGRAPAHVRLIAESGLTSGDQLAQLSRAGYRGFLIGERFMTDADPGRALASLLADAEVATS